MENNSLLNFPATLERNTSSKYSIQEGIPLEIRGVNAYDKYIRVGSLGKGGFARVYKVRKKRESDEEEVNRSCLSVCCSSSSTVASVIDESDTQFYALKVLKKENTSKKVMKYVSEEAELLRKLDHPNIVKIYEIFSYESDVMVLMELCSGGTLWTHGPFTERECHLIMKRILSAVEYMHDLNIVHRDLKVQNILLENDSPNAEIKILDFGLSEQLFDPEEGVTNLRGTIYALAPEVFTANQPYNPKKVDMWAVGVIAYYLFSHEYPFWGPKSKIEAKIKKCEYSFNANIWKTVSKSAKRFITGLLEIDVDKRLTARDANNSEWIKSKMFSRATAPSFRKRAERRNSMNSVASMSSIFSMNSTNSQRDFMAKVQDKIIETTEEEKSSTLIKRVAMMVISHYSASKELLKLRRAFNQINGMNDGVIRVSDFSKAMKRAGWDQEMIDEAFQNLDFDGDGKIEYTEFISATLEAEMVLKREQLKETFDRLDIDCNGYIEEFELREHLGVDYSPSLVQQALEKADKDADGKISYSEFENLFFDKLLENSCDKLEYSMHSDDIEDEKDFFLDEEKMLDIEVSPSLFRTSGMTSSLRSLQSE